MFKKHKDSIDPLSLHNNRSSLMNFAGLKGTSLCGVCNKRSLMQPLLDKYFGKASIVQIE